MKKSLFIGLVAVLGLIGCSRNQEIDVPDANLSLFARTESPAKSRTVVESGVHVYWEPGDEIAVFMGEKSAKFTTDITAASGTATFKGTFGDTTWPEDLDLWAVYPFSEDAVFDGETITTTLPSEQVAREGSFGKDMNLAIAHSNSSTLQFYNVGGGIRFSVTEEGIRKVMFEGLSGEIISGKVKIGLDESGKPIVQEVTGGSQFITLLPPTGKETFEPGAWYYIVAIPGALEGGYKLRFYKDEDYARKVSEKKVEIKRSIFGSLEKADSEIDFEPQTTHFPETEEEIDAAMDMMEQVGEDAMSIIDNLKNDGIQDMLTMAVALEQIDNVVEARVNSTGDVIMVMQKDSVWINIMVNENEFIEGTTAPLNRQKLPNLRKTNKQRSGKKALILLPQFSGFYEELDYLQESLDYAGFDYSDSIYKDSEASIDLFDGGVLDDYDLVYIHTHGCNGYSVKHDDSIFDSEVDDLLCLLSGTKYKKSTLQNLIKQGKLRWEEASVFKGTSGTYFAMTPDYLNNASFSHTCIIIGACMSMMEIHGYRYMANKFLTKGAGAYSGFEDSINTYLSPYLNSRLIEFLCHGFSFQDAFNYWKNSRWTNTICQYLWTQFSNTTYIQPSLWTYQINEEIKNDPFFIVDDAKIELEIPQKSDNGILLTWTCGLSDFRHTQKASYYGDAPFFDETIDAKVSYDVYIDGQPVSSCTTQSTIWENPVIDKHSWHVVVSITEGSTVIASYQSEEGYFTVTEGPHYTTPEAIDLGLPSGIKWASFNLGASKQEDYGEYYAWGETEPYYNCLNPLMWKEGKEAGYDWASYKWCNGTDDTITKYCFDSSYGYNGFTDGKTRLYSEDDAASVNLGDDWRMPTDAEMTELRESCTWMWTTRGGINGYDVTGPNGNSIFLPAAGACDANTGVSTDGVRGFYWTSSLHTDSAISSFGVTFWSSGVGRNGYVRCLGMTIRPVYGESKTTPSGDIEGTEEEPWN